MADEVTTAGPVGSPVEVPVRPLVERLRAGENFYAESSRWFDCELAHAVDEAADEIERAWAARDAAVADLEAHAEAEVRRAVAATRRLLRSALLEEAAQWTGDFRMPVYKGLCDAAKRAGVPLTLDECYQAAKKA